MGDSQGGTLERTETTDSTGTCTGWKVVLINCDCHTFDQVERQLIKAIRCSLSRARALSWEVHSKGSAIVYGGPRERCEAVACVLEEIALNVKVTK